MKLSRYFQFLLLFFICIIANAADQDSFTLPWNGQQYNENALLQAGWADRFFFKNYAFSGNENVLDIGSGDGKISSRIAEGIPAGKVIGIDNSESMYKLSRNKYANFPNLTFIKEDAQNPKFYEKHTRQFDLVVSFVTLHWIKDQKTILNGTYQSLKPKGKFYFKLCSKGGDPIQEIADKLSKGAYRTHFKGFKDPLTRYSPKEYQALLEQANLKVLSINDVEEKDSIQGKANLIKQIKSWLPHYHFLNHKSSLLAEKFIEIVVNTYLLEFPANGEGHITLYDHYLEVIGEKE